LAATSGVHSAGDAIRALLVGADVAMMTTALIRKGAPYVATVLDELETWLRDEEYESVSQLKGSMSRAKCTDPSNLERANYMHALLRFTDEH
ncbi:MAG: hypothetical protein KDA61_09835, partial [Planctomycetales bacterium]|nr:hypothetical protein [Planctomycetales bacterium]